MPLSSRQRKQLRGMSHALHPLVIVAERGLTANVLAEIEGALEHHELVKIKLRGDRDTRREWIETIGRECGAECVHAIGQVACFYRRNADKPVIGLAE